MLMLTEGTKVIVEGENSSLFSKRKRKIEGTILRIYNRFALIQFPHYKECFFLEDIKEV